jgi:hypothetical protein
MGRTGEVGVTALALIRLAAKTGPIRAVDGSYFVGLAPSALLLPTASNSY